MKKRMIIMMSLMLILLLGYIGIGNYKAYVEDIKNKNSKTMLLHSFSVATLMGVDINNFTDSFNLYRNEKSEWEIEGFESLPYQNSMISSYIEIISNVSTERIIEENAKDLSKYGLDKPVIIKYKFKDAPDYIFEVGNRTPDNKSYYAKKRTSSTIYLINSGRGDTFKQSYKDLFVKEFLTEIDSTQISTIKSITFSGIARKEEIVITQIAQNQDSQVSTMFRMIMPEKYDVDSDLTNSILNELTGIMRAEVLKVFPDKSLVNSSGLANPEYIVSVNYSKGISKLSVGKLNEKGKRYIMREGVDILFAVDNEKLKWIFTRKEDFPSNTPFIRDINTIENILVNFSKPLLSLQLKIDYKKQKFLSNDKEISISKITEFCTHISKITTAGIISDEQQVRINDKSPDFIMTYSYNNNSDSDKIEIYQIDDWLYLFKINGSGQLTITKQVFEELKKASLEMF